MNRRPPPGVYTPVRRDLLKGLAEEPEVSLRDQTRPAYYGQQRADSRPEGYRDDWLRRDTSPY